MKNPDSHDPAKTRNADTQRAFGPSRFSPNKSYPEETRFQGKRRHTFHGESLSEDSAADPRGVAPVGPELELHGYAGDYAHREIDGENLRPKPRGVIVVFAPRVHRHGLENQDEQRETHGQLGKNVVKRNGKGEMKTVNGESVHSSIC